MKNINHHIGEWKSTLVMLISVLLFACESKKHTIEDKLPGIWVMNNDIYDVNNNHEIDPADSGSFNMPCTYIMNIEGNGKVKTYYGGVNHYMLWEVNDSGRFSFYLPDKTFQDFRFVLRVTEDTLCFLDTVDNGMYNWEVFYKQ